MAENYLALEVIIVEEINAGNIASLSHITTHWIFHHQVETNNAGVTPGVPPPHHPCHKTDTQL